MFGSELFVSFELIENTSVAEMRSTHSNEQLRWIVTS
jgi:hypothetical protein